MLEQCATHEEAMKVAEIYKSFTFIVTISKTMPPYDIYCTFGLPIPITMSPSGSLS